MTIEYVDLLPIIIGTGTSSSMGSGDVLSATDSKGIWTVVNTTGIQIPQGNGFDKNDTTYLRTATSGVVNTYIELEFPQNYLIGKYKLVLGKYNTRYTNMASWEIHARVNNTWITVHSGTNGESMATNEYEFSPVMADAIRIKCTGKHGTNSWGFDDFYLYEAIAEPSNKTLILWKNEYNTYNSGWQTVSSTPPSESQYLSDGIDDLSVLERKVQSLPSIKMNKSEILFQNGKLFAKTIDLNKYMDIRSIKVEVK